MALPIVTISILNHQRKETLRLGLERAVAQQYPHLEVIVVDNASTDGSDRIVEDEFPQVRLIRLAENVGCAARNVGVASAKGEIVITIDNDVLLSDTNAVSTVVELFARHPSAACVNFRILDGAGNLSQRDWCHPRDWRRFGHVEFHTDYVLEGASAFRRDAFQHVGGYWGPFFIGHEGLDLALRTIDAGYEILYSPAVSVQHVVSREARPSSRIYYTFVRNGIWIALRHHRPLPAVASILQDMALVGFASLRAREVRACLRGGRDAIMGAGGVLRLRKPLSRATYRRLARIRALRPSLIQRVSRHVRSRLI